MSKFKITAATLATALALGSAPAQAQDLAGSIQDTTSHIGNQLTAGGPRAWIGILFGLPVAGSLVAGSLLLKQLGICPPGDTSCSGIE